MLGCVSAKCCVSLFYLCFKVLQLLKELNYRGGLNLRISFSFSLALPFPVLFLNEEGLLLLPMEQEEL
jgi:hypothetical protein